MGIVDQLKKFRGRTVQNQRYTLMFVPNGKHSFSDYYQTGDTDPVFYLTEHYINGRKQAILNSDTNSIVESPSEGKHGMLFLNKVSNYTFQTHVDSSDKTELSVSLTSSTMDDTYVGLPYSMNNNTINGIFKKDPTYTDVFPMPSIRHSSTKRINPTSLKFTTSTATISASANYIDLSAGSGYTPSSSVINVNSGSYVTVTDGTNTEYMFVRYFDPDSHKILVEREKGGTTARAWSGTYSIYAWFHSSPANYDPVTDAMFLGLDVYVVPHPDDCYARSFITMNTLYDQYYFPNAQVYSYITANQYYLHPPAVNHFYFTNGIYPDNLLTGTVNNRISKGTNQYTDIFFTTAYEADQGYVYDYCEQGQICGPCMGATGNVNELCVVSADAWNPDSDFAPLTSSKDEHDPSFANWNKRNRMENSTVPLVLCISAGIFMFLLLISYIIWFGVFETRLKDLKYVKNDFTSELSTANITTKALGIISGFLLVGTIAWLTYATIESKDINKKPIWPIKNFNRSEYNPPPGYTFRDAPSSK